jgi:Zn-dependent M28 family amino/carboxypeptidase
VAFAGAHLDSVPEDPGINDKGSGSATLLEVAGGIDELDIRPRNKVRFAFWGAEESALLGATHFVSQLSAREKKNIAVYLNFDMVGSPNYGRFIYDGDGDAFCPAGPTARTSPRGSSRTTSGTRASPRCPRPSTVARITSPS